MKYTTKVIDGVLHAHIDSLKKHPLNDDWQSNDYDTQHISETIENGVGLIHPPSVLKKKNGPYPAGTTVSGHTRWFDKIETRDSFHNGIDKDTGKDHNWMPITEYETELDLSDPLNAIKVLEAASRVRKDSAARTFNQIKLVYEKMKLVKRKSKIGIESIYNYLWKDDSNKSLTYIKSIWRIGRHNQGQIYLKKIDGGMKYTKAYDLLFPPTPKKVSTPPYQGNTDFEKIYTTEMALMTCIAVRNYIHQHDKIKIGLAHNGKKKIIIPGPKLETKTRSGLVSDQFMIIGGECIEMISPNLKVETSTSVNDPDWFFPLYFDSMEIKATKITDNPSLTKFKTGADTERDAWTVFIGYEDNVDRVVVILAYVKKEDWKPVGGKWRGCQMGLPALYHNPTSKILVGEWYEKSSGKVVINSKNPLDVK